MSATNIGPNIGLNGVDQYKQDLEMAKAATKAFKAELESFGKIKEPFAKAVGQTSALEKEIAAQQIAIKGLTEKYGEAVNKYGQYSKQAFKAQEELAKANKALSAMIDEYKGLSTAKITIPGVGEFKRDIETLTQSTKTFKSEFQAITSGFGIEGAFKRASESSKTLNDAIKVQKETITVLKEEYDKTAAEQGEFSQGAMEMREKVANATVELNNMEKTLRDLPNGFQVAGQEVVEYGNKWKNIGNEFTQVAKPFNAFTGVYAAGMGGAIKISMDFEAQMARVKAVTDATPEAYTKLEEKARQVGKETIFTATQAAEALEMLGRAGYGPQESIDTLSAVMDLAAADGIELADAASIVADNLNALGMDSNAKNAVDLVDLLAQTSRSSNTDVLKLAESLKYAAPSFAALGWEAEDASFALGLAADYGVKASQAGTGLRQALKNLTAGSDTVKEAMDKYNITLDDGTGKAKTFERFLGELRTTFGGLEVDVLDANGELKDGEALMEEYGNKLPISQLEKLQAITDIFGTRALPTMLALINTSEEDFNDLADALNNSEGAARDMAQAFEESTEGRWMLLKSAIEEVALSFGESLLPVAKDFLDVAKSWVDRFNSMDEGTRNFIITAGGIVALIGPILTGIGGITSGIGTLIGSGGHLLSGIGGIVNLIGGAGAAGGGGLIASLGGLVAAAGPVVIAIAAVAGVALLIYKNWDTVGPFLAKTWEGIKTNASNIWNGIKNFFVGTWEGIKTNATNTWNAITGFLSGTWNGIKTNATNVYNGIKTFISGTWNGIKTNTSNIWNGIKTFISGVLNGIKTNFSNAYNAIKDVVSRVLSGIKTNTENIFNAIKGIVTRIKETFENLVKSALNWGLDLVGNIAKGIASGIGDVINAVTSVANEITSRLHFSVPDKGPLADADTYMPDFMHLLASGMRNNLGLLRAASNEVASAIAPDFYMDLPESGSSTTTNMGGVNIVINAQPGQDVYELADIVEERISSLMERREAAYA